MIDGRLQVDDRSEAAALEAASAAVLSVEGLSGPQCCGTFLDGGGSEFSKRGFRIILRQRYQVRGTFWNQKK
jgi:hypothetical protein